MTITKYAQCCLLIEVAGKRVLTDPGRFSTEQNELTEIDLILITHEHADHLHTESLQAVLAKNPQAIVVCNSAVGKLLAEAGIAYELLEGRAVGTHADLALEAFDGPHVEIFEDFGIVQNTGYFIDDTLFYPGDAYTEPGKAVPVLALPVAGPWCKLTEALHYALRVQPKQVFPVHDYLLNEDGMQLVHGLTNTQLTKAGIAFTPLKNKETKSFNTTNHE